MSLIEIAREIEMALRDFEPRLAPESIKARRDDRVAADDVAQCGFWSGPICAVSR